MPYRSVIETPAKWDLLRQMGYRFGLDTLVETGGYHGGTMEYLRGDFARLVTVELGAELFEDIYRRGIPNVLCLKGDSGRVLRQFLMFFPGPALFWLDAHPSGGDTVGGEVPDRHVVGIGVIDRELDAVLGRGNALDVVLVDDVGHPGLDKGHLLEVVSRHDGWEVRFSGVFPNCIGMVTFKGRVIAEGS